MKKYEVNVPYSEVVYGYSKYIVEANSEEDAKKIMASPEYYKYFYDAEQDGSENYEEHMFDMTIEEIK